MHSISRSMIVRAQQPAAVFSNPLQYCSYNFGKKSTGVSFQKDVAAGANRPESDEMDEDHVKKQDSMSSFGEGYATRSDEEGFGGVYGGNQDDVVTKKDDDQKEKVTTTDRKFDKQQGSEVKEKEKSPHQKDPSS